MKILHLLEPLEGHHELDADDDEGHVLHKTLHLIKF